MAASDMGGETLLSSARMVHDRIEEIDQNLLEALYTPFYTDRRGQEAHGKLPYDVSSIFASYDDGELRCQYHQPFYQGAQDKFPEIPRLTSIQSKALSTFDEVSLHEDIVYTLKLNSGCMIFVHNEKILHGRRAYQSSHGDLPRHLLRFWMNTPHIKHTFPNFLGY